MRTDATTLGPHLTFAEQAGEDAYPCTCWQAGRGDITGLSVEQVQHPDEYREGAQAAYEEAYDL
jgi:hypothetical protein